MSFNNRFSLSEIEYEFEVARKFTSIPQFDYHFILISSVCSSMILFNSMNETCNLLENCMSETLYIHWLEF